MNTAKCCPASGCCPAPTMPAIPTASTQLTFKDIFGGWKVRWGIGRMNYRVAPGLYAVGKPDKNSPILVSANYKLTFDSLRKELSGLNCWLLILDTKGVNVWCAAGKGTFGTEELINRLAQTGLAEKVATKTLIVPQLGAPGINANEVKRQTGFTVAYGPVRAGDIKAFLAAGNQATEQMRTVKFTLYDRLVLTPLEIVLAAKVTLFVFGILFLLNLFITRPFGITDFTALTGAVLVGALITPVLLPFIPGRAFAFKGGLLGLIWAVSIVCWLGAAPGYLLVLPAIAAFLAMNFTGASTYTSPSGVLKEMKVALPIILIALVLGVIWVLLSHIVGL